MFSSNTTQVSDGGYQISRSLRFNSADSAYLNRTPATTTNRRTWTWSGWVKRGKIGDWAYLFQGSAGNPTGGLDDGTAIRLSSVNNQLTVYNLYNSSSTVEVSTQAVFRDPSAWYHIVVAMDTTQATSTDRIKVYVNGAQITVFGTSTYPTQNEDLYVNTTNPHLTGALTRDGGGAQLFNDGLMTEINFIDGQQLTPSSFGYTNPATGVWSPLKFVGTYGTNGFYLNFSDNSNTTAATLGKDYSGNGNNWTPNNFSVTAGAGNDSLVDSPTSYGVDTGVGGTVRGNYCTLNPLSVLVGTTSNGNLDGDTGTTNGGVVYATMNIPNSGKWYWEYTQTNTGTSYSGLETTVSSTSASTPNNIWYVGDGTKQVNGTTTSYGASYGNTDIIGTAVDVDAGTVTFYKNGTSQGAITYATASLNITPSWRDGSGSVSLSFNANFGQRPFAYTAPSGFKALCTQNLPTPTIGATTATQASKFFTPVLYTGNGSTQTVTVGFQPDWVWLKNRSSAGDNGLYDVLRGTTNRLVSNSTNAADTISGVTAFNSSGFSLGADYNASANTFVSWNWKANGSGSTNTAGSITSTVSANTTSGFSVVTYTGNGTSGATVGHGLGVAPRMIIIKRRETPPSSANWIVYHSAIGNTGALVLDLTAGTQTSSAFFNNTSPTSSVVTFGNDANTNNNTNTYVAYCFAPIAGYSAIGSYTGNGSTDGTFVFTGMRPAFVIIKRTDDVGEWVMKDTTRSPFNADGNTLLANRSDAEYGSGNTSIDELSNGFKLRTTSASANFNGSTYTYMAFASNPFKYSLAR